MRKRVKKLEERLANNPDPTRLKSNKLLYELEIEKFEAQLEAYKQGKLFGFITGLLGQAMGITPADYGLYVPQESAMNWFNEVRSKGQVGDACDMSIIIWARQDHIETPFDRFAYITSNPCTVQYLASLQYMYRYKENVNKDLFTYYMDVGIEENDANLEHVVDQLHEMIELLEKRFPGYKYDEDKLKELQAYEEKALVYYKEIYEMQRHKPAPLGGRDAFWQFGQPGVTGIWPNPARAVEYAKARRDEIAERIEKGIFAVPNERARVVWTVTRPFFMDNFKPLEKWGIVVPLFYEGLTNVRVPLPNKNYYGSRKLTPLEKEAAAPLRELWYGKGDKWVDPLVWICRDLQIDGVINYCQRGATCTLGLKKTVEDRLEKELGIPTLQLEGTEWDNNYRNEAEITAELDDFAQLLLSRKGLL